MAELDDRRTMEVAEVSEAWPEVDAGGDVTTDAGRGEKAEAAGAAVHLAKRSLNGAPLVLGPQRHTLSVQEVGRPLLTAEEVRRLPDGEAVVFVSGHAAIRGRRVPYFADGELAGRVGQATRPCVL